MRKYISICVILLIIFLSSCTNEQLKEQIDKCNKDPECRVIVDEAIESELEARGIESSNMTNVELKEINDLYVALSEKETLVQLELPYYREVLFEELEDRDSYNITDEQFELYQDVYEAVSSGSNIDSFELTTLYEAVAQYLVINNTKHLVYPVGNRTFKYEIRSVDEVQEYTIDLDFGSIVGDEISLVNNEQDFVTKINSGELDNIHYTYRYYNDRLYRFHIQERDYYTTLSTEVYTESEAIYVSYDVDLANGNMHLHTSLISKENNNSQVNFITNGIGSDLQDKYYLDLLTDTSLFREEQYDEFKDEYDVVDILSGYQQVLVEFNLVNNFSLNLTDVPKLSLNGENPYYMDVWAIYVEEGFELENFDLTGKEAEINIDDSFSVDSPGEYQIEYHLEVEGLHFHTVRTVIIEEPSEPTIIIPSGDHVLIDKEHGIIDNDDYYIYNIEDDEYSSDLIQIETTESLDVYTKLHKFNHETLKTQYYFISENVPTCDVVVYRDGLEDPYIDLSCNGISTDEVFIRLVGWGADLSYLYPVDGKIYIDHDIEVGEILVFKYYTYNEEIYIVRFDRINDTEIDFR